jgi:hypothetical protein
MRSGNAIGVGCSCLYRGECNFRACYLFVKLIENNRLWNQFFNALRFATRQMLNLHLDVGQPNTPFRVLEWGSIPLMLLGPSSEIPKQSPLKPLENKMMKSSLNRLAVAAVLACGLTAGQAYASPSCSLSISSESIPVGQAFSFSASVYELLPGPLPPPDFPMYQLYFYGINPGPTGIGPEPAPTPLAYGGSTFTGYYNPGGIGGAYHRVAAIYSGSRFVCWTNWVSTYLHN